MLVPWGAARRIPFSRVLDPCVCACATEAARCSSEAGLCAVQRAGGARDRYGGERLRAHKATDERRARRRFASALLAADAGATARGLCCAPALASSGLSVCLRTHGASATPVRPRPCWSIICSAVMRRSHAALGSACMYGKTHPCQQTSDVSVASSCMHECVHSRSWKQL